jgi:hypothetical protein
MAAGRRQKGSTDMHPELAQICSHILTGLVILAALAGLFWLAFTRKGGPT